MAQILAVHINQLDTTTWDSTDVVRVKVSFSIQRTGFAPINANNFPVELYNKNILGLYKTAIELNNDLLTAVKALAEMAYGVPGNGYDAAWVTGGFGVLNLL